MGYYDVDFHKTPSFMLVCLYYTTLPPGVVYKRMKYSKKSTY
jgi:hypothetical protein